MSQGVAVCNCLPKTAWPPTFDKSFGVSKKAQSGGYGKVTADRTLEDVEKRRNDRWNILFVAGMWFQDLFNYDFRRTEQCIIPYATQEGEISFCAYNTGIGWRNIIEKMHMTATLTKWYEEHGRHEIFAGGKKVSISDGVQLKALKLNRDLITEEEQHDSAGTWQEPHMAIKPESSGSRSEAHRVVIRCSLFLGKRKDH